MNNHFSTKQNTDWLFSNCRSVSTERDQGCIQYQHRLLLINLPELLYQNIFNLLELVAHNHTLCRFVDNIYLHDTHVGCGYEACCYQPFTQQQDGHHNEQNDCYSNDSAHHHGGVALDLRLGCGNHRKGNIY